MGFSLAFVDYLVIGLYLILMLSIGWIFTRLMKGGKDFFIGGRSIPWWVAGVSLYMTLFSAWTFTGAASFVYNTGWYGIIYFAMWPLALFIGFRMTAVRWRRARISTPVEFVKTRFNEATHLFLTIVLIVSSLYWPAHHLASLSKICAPALFPNSMLAIDGMIVAVGLIIMIYTFGGGLWAVCFTDFVQFLIFISICGVLIPLCFASGDLGSVSEFIARTPPLEFTHVIRGNATYSIWYLIGLPLIFVFSYSTGGNVQRYFSVRDERSALGTGWLAVALFALAPFLFGLPPLIGKVLWPDISMMPFFSNITKPDENIFIAVVLNYLPAGMVGLFLAAMMSASMSAMDSAWNVVSAMVSIDIYKRFFKPDATEKETLLVGRLTVIILAVMAIVMALLIIHSEYGVFTVSNIVIGLVGIPVTIPLFVGILTRRISRWSAIATVLAGTIVSALCRYVLAFDLGPQYIITVFVALLFTLASQPLGRLYQRSKRLAVLVNLGIVAALYSFFITVNANPLLSWKTLANGFANGIPGLIDSPHLWLALAALVLAAISLWFTRLYAQDLDADQSEIERFFDKLATPVDVEREVLAESPEEFNAFPLVGKISIALAGFALLLLAFPEGRAQPVVNLAVGGFLALFGGVMFYLDRR